MNIGSLVVGPDHPCRFVGELSNAHNGDLGRAVAILDALKAAGADAAKFQAYTPDELIRLRGDGPAPEPWGSQGWTMRTLYGKAQTPLKWLPRLAQHCDDIGLPWFSSVFGETSLALLDAIDCPAYKLAAIDQSSRKLAKMVKAMGKPVLRSTHAPLPPKTDDFWLYCPPGYPQEAVSRGSVACFPGFSYHGTDVHLPLYAAMAGAQLVECHVMLPDAPSELEAAVCLTTDQLGAVIGAYHGARLVLQ